MVTDRKTMLALGLEVDESGCLEGIFRLCFNGLHPSGYMGFLRMQWSGLGWGIAGGVCLGRREYLFMLWVCFTVGESSSID